MKSSLRDAAKRLLWEKGYASMSPRQILDASGAGQGSLYHHYRGKADLAADALSEIQTEMSSLVSAIFDPGKAPLDRVRDYLLLKRNGLKGCRMGRLANEAEVLELPELREPIARYFEHVKRLIVQALKEAKSAGSINRSTDAVAIATAIVATVQGGFLLSRAQSDAEQIRLATRGALAMLEALKR